MTTTRNTTVTALGAALLAGGVLFAQGVPGCGGEEDTCTVGDKQSCPPDKVCEEVKAASGAVTQTRCFGPTDVHGRVSDAKTDGPLTGARIVMWDAKTLVSLGDATTTGAIGTYTVPVMVPRVEGQILRQTVDLRVSAPGYLDYPGGVRTNEPVILALATTVAEGDAHVRDVSLAPIDMAPAGAITGKVSGGLPGGAVLVVAEAGGKGWSGVADRSGSFVINNVPDGSYELRGYLREWSYGPVSIGVTGGPATAPDLAGQAASGSVRGRSKTAADAIPGDKTTAVVAVKTTGEFIPGLRAEVKNDGTYEVKGIPAGNLVVLVSQENDDLIRDPNVAGELGGIDHAFTGSDAFDATGREVPLIQALPLKHPGLGFETGVGIDTLRWDPVTGAEEYLIEVLDVFGAVMMGGTFTVPAKDVPMAGGTLSVDAILKPGLHYQWRATAKKSGAGGMVITKTEDRKGQFFKLR